MPNFAILPSAILPFCQQTQPRNNSAHSTTCAALPPHLTLSPMSCVSHTASAMPLSSPWVASLLQFSFFPCLHHLVNPSPHHPAVLSPHHLTTPLTCHPVTLSPCHLATFSHHHYVMTLSTKAPYCPITFLSLSSPCPCPHPVLVLTSSSSSPRPRLVLVSSPISEYP